MNYIAASTIGNRETQQDSLFVGEENGCVLAVICDGMGGMQGGELASQLAVEHLTQAFYRGNIKSIPHFFKQNSMEIDEEIFCLEKDGKYLGAGTTMVAIFIRKDGLHWLSIGDSKIYIYRHGQMVCPVQSHTYQNVLNKLLLEEEITEKQYQAQIHKGDALTSFLGMGGLRQLEINYNPFVYENGDLVLLCSDGLYKCVCEEEIKSVLECSILLEEKVRMLLEKAKKNSDNHQDNTSIILLEM